MPSVLLAHPWLRLGGSELRVLWAAQALRQQYQVAVATLHAPPLAALNQHCGTTLRAGDLQFLAASRSATIPFGWTDALRGALFARHLRARAAGFDICISAYNPLDFGRPALQFIADISFDDRLRAQFRPPVRGCRGWFHRSSGLRRGYLEIMRRIAGHSGYDGSRDWLIANSAWTARVLQERFGWECERVIYPPVAPPSVPLPPWTARAHSFVIASRISPEKRIVWMIDRIAQVRAAGHDVKLHIIGSIGTDAYGQRVRRRIADNAGWCVAEGYRSGAEKMALLSRHRFALHGLGGEAFGIAVAEYLQAGCIPFVPALGGPAEIVSEEELCFSDEAEAVAKMSAVLASEDRQTQLRAALAGRAEVFSAQRFAREVIQLVQDWRLLQGRGGGDGWG